MNMLQFFKEGDEIYGFCNGYFGRDDYEDKVCVMVRPGYAVFEYLNPDMIGATILDYDARLINCVQHWKKREDE